MALQTFANGESGLSVRTKINANFTELYARKAETVSVRDFYNPSTSHPWADAFEAAANSFGFSKPGHVIVPYGQYQLERSVVTPRNIQWTGDGAELYASVNNQRFFESDITYFSRFRGFSFFGNGFSGVQCFNLKNWRLAAEISDCQAHDTSYLAFLGEGCFGAVISNCTTLRVPFPVRVGPNNAVFRIVNPSFDNGATVAGTGTGIGVEIATGGVSPNVGVNITGGYIQGFEYGVVDGGIGTTLDTVYFEANTEADVYGSNAQFSEYRSCSHPASIGEAAYRLRNCKNVTMYNPLVPPGERDQVFDVDSTNTNCTFYMPENALGWNSPTGSLAHLGRIPRETRGSATAAVVGSVTPGTTSYIENTMIWQRTDSGAHVEISLQWTGHTGTGNIVITGIPAALTPSTFSPMKFGHIVVSGFAIAAGQIYTYFNGTGTNLSVAQVDTTGAATLVPLPTAGKLSIVLDYQL